jgi:hypothetical protein
VIAVFIAVIVVIVLLGFLVASFFVRRHGEASSPDPTWRPTDEVFRDPSTNRLMRVWEDPERGTRHYLPERRPPS